MFHLFARLFFFFFKRLFIRGKLWKLSVYFSKKVEVLWNFFGFFFFCSASFFFLQIVLFFVAFREVAHDAPVPNMLSIGYGICKTNQLMIWFFKYISKSFFLRWRQRFWNKTFFTWKTYLYRTPIFFQCYWYLNGVILITAWNENVFTWYLLLFWL